METFWFFRLRFRRAYDSAYDSDFRFSLGHKALMTLMTLMTYDSDYDSDSDSLASENQPLYFTGKSYAKKGFANLKNLFSFICGFRIPDTGYRIPDSGFRIPVSCSGFLFRIPVSGFWGCLKWSWKAPRGVSNYVQCSNVPICSNKSSLENSFASQIDIWCGGMAQAPPSGTLWPQNSSLCNSLQGFFT